MQTLIDTLLHTIVGGFIIWGLGNVILAILPGSMVGYVGFLLLVSYLTGRGVLK